jgi:hypothetical protein
MDGKEVDHARLARCIYDMYLVGVVSKPRLQENLGPALFISFLHGDLTAVQ